LWIEVTRASRGLSAIAELLACLWWRGPWHSNSSERGTKHVFPVNLTQIHSTIPEIFHSQTKKHSSLTSFLITLQIYKIHFASSKSCILLYWQHYCTAFKQSAQAKLCGIEHTAPRIIGREAVTLGIGPHSSFKYSCMKWCEDFPNFL